MAEAKSLYKVPSANCISEICHLCKRMSSLRSDIPCRVCGNVYHRSCLESSGRYDSTDMELVDNAFTMTGWSCADCDNVVELLSAEEDMQLSDKFEDVDMNHDEQLSCDEYLKFRERITEKTFDDHDRYRETLQFKMMDTDNDGFINLSDFLKNEAVLMLARRDKGELMNLLTPLEVKSARIMFQLLSDEKETIDLLATKLKTFEVHWYTTLQKTYLKKVTSMRSCGSSATRATLHGVVSTSILMESDENQDGLVTWEEFLRGQALFIIASRPNVGAADIKL